MAKEIWKDVIGLEGKYQVSDKGRVRSLDYEVERSKTSNFINKGKILKQSKNGGYLRVCIGGRPRYVHHLVAESFLNHFVKSSKNVLDHINMDKLDNRLSNLRVVTNRFNCSRDRDRRSDYVGVFWRENRKTWYSQIQINGKIKYLGSNKNQEVVSQMYQNALKHLC